MTIEPVLIAAVPATSLAARLMVVDALRTTERVSAVAVGGVVTVSLGAFGSRFSFVLRTPYRVFVSCIVFFPVPPSMQLPFPKRRLERMMESSPASPPTPDPRRERLSRTVIESLPAPPSTWIR